MGTSKAFDNNPVVLLPASSSPWASAFCQLAVGNKQMIIMEAMTAFLFLILLSKNINNIPISSPAPTKKYGFSYQCADEIPSVSALAFGNSFPISIFCRENKSAPDSASILTVKEYFFLAGNTPKIS